MGSNPTINDLFQGGDIAKIVGSFDFSKLDIHDVNAHNYLHVDLAPSYQALNSDVVKQMDDQLKIMIAGAVKAIGALAPADRSWDAVKSALLASPLLEPDGEGIFRTDSLSKNSTNDWKFDGSPDSAIVKEVKDWFDKLISDEQVLKDTAIKIDDVAGIVAQTGATVSDFESFFFKHEYHEVNLLDIGILRFPDIDHPYFRVYRISLKAWSDSSRTLFHSDDKNGISGEFNSQNFKPRASVIDQLTAPVRQKAIEVAEALFP